MAVFWGKPPSTVQSFIKTTCSGGDPWAKVTKDGKWTYSYNFANGEEYGTNMTLFQDTSKIWKWDDEKSTCTDGGISGKPNSTAATIYFNTSTNNWEINDSVYGITVTIKGSGSETTLTGSAQSYGTTYSFTATWSE